MTIRKIKRILVALPPALQEQLEIVHNSLKASFPFSQNDVVRAALEIGLSHIVAQGGISFACNPVEPQVVASPEASESDSQNPAMTVQESRG